jgi:hypothetical protein
MADDAKKKLKDVNEELGYIEEQILTIADKLSSAVKDALEDIRDEAKGISEIFGKNLNKSITSIAKGSDTILKNTQKLYDKTAKVADIQKDINNLDIKKLATLKNIDIASRNGLLTDIQKQAAIHDLNEATSFQNTLLQEQLDIATKLEATAKQTDKDLGIFAGVLKGIGKIPILGDLVDTKDALQAAREETEKTGSGLKGLKAGLGNLKGQVVASLTNPANIALFVITQMVEALVGADKATGELAKSFNLSYSAAGNLRSELTDIANSSNDVAVNTKGLQESMVAVGQSLGSNARLNKEDLITFTKLREQAGYTNEELVSMQRLTLSTGGSLEKNSKTFLGTVAKLNAQNKLAINAKQLFKDIANVSDAIKLSVGGTSEKIAEAAFKARQFGINLQQADQISSSLLDFESSINNQISAELITGKELNMDKARLLALNGDIAGASAEILKQVGGTAEFTKMNRIQQEALAKAVGMSRDDLAKSLMDREAAAKLGAKEGQSSQDAYNAAVKKYGVEKANQMLGDDALATQFQQQSVQERLVQIVEKLKEVFISIAEPLMAIISPIVDVLAPVLTGISTVVGYIVSGFKTLGPVLKPILGIISTIFLAMKAEAIMSVIANSWKALGGLPIVGPALAIGAIAGGIGYINSQKIKDGMISPDGGLMVSGAKGTYKLDPNDHVIAGTDLNKRTPAAGGGGGQDLSPLLNEMKALRQEQAKSNSKPTVVENSMNGTKFGTSVAMNTYKTQ